MSYLTCHFKYSIFFLAKTCQDITSRDPENWSLHEWLYNGIMYKNVEELRAAMKEPGFERIPLNLDGDWTNLEDYSPGTIGREHPGPVMVLASPPRYGVDIQQKFVSWSRSRD